MNETKDDNAPMEIISGDALAHIERAQIDTQIATAKKYPRSIRAFLDEAQTMISLNEETAQGCNYKLKRKDKDGGTVWIEGPSIRLLEIAASAYTNLRYGSRIISMDAEFVTSQGVAFDLQKNVASTVEVKRSIVTKQGRRYSADMIMVTSNAAGSIARRNALNGIIPRAYILNLADYAKKIALGDIKSLPERRQRAFDYFTKTLGQDVKAVLQYLERPSIDDCDLSDLDKLQGLKTALKDGDITLEEAFHKPKGDAALVSVVNNASENRAEAEAGLAPAPASLAGSTHEAGGQRTRQPSLAPAEGNEASLQAALEKLVTEPGFTFQQFVTWADGSGVVPDATSYASFEDVPNEICKRLLRAKTGMLKGLEMTKEAK